MKRSLFVAGALVAMPWMAQAQEFAPLPGFYIGAGAGGVWYLSSTTSVGGSFSSTTGFLADVVAGYDNFKKKYVSFWIDDAGTGMFSSEGTADAAGKMFTFHGKMDDPMTGEKDKPIKMILRTVNANKRVFEMHDLSKGEKSLFGEMTYTRK